MNRSRNRGGGHIHMYIIKPTANIPSAWECTAMMLAMASNLTEPEWASISFSSSPSVSSVLHAKGDVPSNLKVINSNLTRISIKNISESALSFFFSYSHIFFPKLLATYIRLISLRSSPSIQKRPSMNSCTCSCMWMSGTESRNWIWRTEYWKNNNNNVSDMT